MELQEIINKTGELPTLPAVALRINNEMQNESLTAKLLAKIICEDTSLSSKLLRLANSAFYGMPKQVTSIEKAVTILGFNAVKNMALGVSVFSLFKENNSSSIDVIGLWHHCMGCAVACKALLARSCAKVADEAFLFGIIHDIGVVVLIKNNLSDMEKVAQLMASRGLLQSDAEKEVFGFTHQRIGAALLREWNFPESLVLGVKLHHNIPPTVKKYDFETGQLIRSLCVANQMCKALGLGMSIDPKRQKIPDKLWDYLQVDKESLAELGSEIKGEFSSILEAWQE